MKVRSGSGMKGRSAGLVVAGALALVLAGVVLLVAINNRTAPGDGDDLAVDVSANPPNFGDGVVDIAAQTTGRFQAVDRNDPGRVAWELLFDRLDPLGGGQYRLTEPRAWFYFKDGQAVHIRADAGTIKKPSATDSQIENGEFVGNVVASAFGVQGVGTDGVPVPRDPNRDDPWLLALTDRVSFDSVLLELSTRDPVLVSTAGVQFEGRSLLVRGNQVDNRLEYLSVGGPGLIRYALGSEEDADGAANAPPAESGADGADAATKAPRTERGVDPDRPVPPPPTVAFEDADLYRAVFLDEVIVTQTGRKLSADALELWARVVDNKIPSAPKTHDSVASVPVAAEETPLVRTMSGERARSGAAGRSGPGRGSGLSLNSASVVPVVFQSATSGPRRSLFREAADDVVLSWRGTLTAAPLEAQPAELPDANHLHARFTAVKSGGVRFRDAGTGGSGRSALVDYAVTTRELSLRGSPATGPAWVHLPRSGVFMGDRVLAKAASGEVEMIGSGVMAAESDAPPQDEFGPLTSFGRFDPARLSALSRIEWADRSDLLFVVRDGTMTGELRKADFEGRVAAHDGASTLRSEQLSVCFDHALCGDQRAQGATAMNGPTVRAFGVGAFEHDIDPADRGPGDPERLVVTWKASMFFEDPADGPAHIRCDGDTVATATGPLASDVLKSNRMHLYFVDEREAAARSTPDASASGLLAGSRRLERAEAVGSIEEDERGSNASIESRRYTAPAPDQPRTLSQIIYLEGPRIIAEQAAGLLSVPSAGQAVVFDRRDEPAEGAVRREGAGAGGGGDPSAGARGTSRFRWQGDFKLLRDAAKMEIREAVEMVHQPIDDQPWVRLTCAQLDAMLVTESMAAANPTLKAGRLSSALADRDVLIESADSKRIVAERASFDVVANRVEASSEPPNTATFFDDQSAAPLRARRLRWDLGRDRVEIMEPAPITVPR